MSEKYVNPFFDRLDATLKEYLTVTRDGSDFKSSIEYFINKKEEDDVTFSARMNAKITEYEGKGYYLRHLAWMATESSVIASIEFRKPGTVIGSNKNE